MGHAAAAAKILGPVVVILTFSHGGIADADVTIIGTQYIRTVSIAAHPSSDHSLWGRVPGGDVLAASGVFIAGFENTLVKCAAILAGVAEVVVIPHVLRVQSRRNSQFLVVLERRQIVGRPLGVDKLEDL